MIIFYRELRRLYSINSFLNYDEIIFIELYQVKTLKLIIGSRGSKLALVQTYYVKDLLEKIDENLDIEIKVVKTRGDVDQRSPITWG